MSTPAGSRPELLVVSPRFLFPLDQGGKIRTANILRCMQGGAFRTTLASPAPIDVERFAPDIAGVCDRFLSWPETRASRVRRMLAGLVDPLPVAVAADRSAAGQRVVAAALAARPDVVLVDFPHAAVLLPRRLQVPSVLFTHNVEAEIFERHAAVARGIWRPVWHSQARRMRRFEGSALRGFTTVVAVSERDREALVRSYQLTRVERIDTGVDLEFYGPGPPVPAAPADGGTVVFTGAMDWRANIDGVTFLLDEVWPLVRRARPRARAVIVGRNPPETLVARAAAMGADWRFTGFVDDIRPFVAEAHAYAIPLRVGSGTRIKAFEAMAMGRPVVSTRVGVEGLEVVAGEHLLIADDAPAFAQALLRLLDRPQEGAALSAAARALVEARFSWAHVARQFEAILLAARQ